MDVARLNASHADLEWHARVIERLRKEIPTIPLLLDVPGRKIRTGQLHVEPSFGAGETVVFTTDQEEESSGTKVPVSYPDLHKELAGGDVILADDGSLRFTVTDVAGRDVVCRAESAGTLRSHKGINLPGLTLRGAFLSERDRRIIMFAAQHGVDFLGISFVECAEHVEVVRALCADGTPQIVAKIETQGALDSLQDIVETSDALMIDRGDLSVQTTMEHITLLQKRILSEARRAARPAIVATEMLHSMIESPTPTKAEVSDISNAILDGASALMLSAETAIGRYPVEAVALMRRVVDAVSDHLQDSLDREHHGAGTGSVPHAMEDAIALISRRLPITKIVAVTLSGYAARMVSSRMPRQPILAVTNDPERARWFNLLPGTEGVCVDVPFSKTSTDHIAHCLERLWQRGRLVDEDLILVTSVGYPKSGNRMNLIQTHRVSDLRESLGWKR